MKRTKKQTVASPAVDLVALAEIAERFPSRTIVLLGDFVADVFQYGEITRVSREAPVLILRHRETQIVPGGGANAANNFASLGAKVIPITAVGDDDTGVRLINASVNATSTRPASFVPKAGPLPLKRVSSLAGPTPSRSRFSASTMNPPILSRKPIARNYAPPSWQKSLAPTHWPSPTTA